MSEELLLLLVEVWALLMYRLSSFICRRETAGELKDSNSEAMTTPSLNHSQQAFCSNLPAPSRL